MLPFCGHLYRVSHQQLNTNKFKIFEYFGIWIETFELTTVEYRRMKKLDSEIKIWITWWKIRPGTKQFVWFRWFFELCEFKLKTFSCKGLLANSEGTEELVGFRWSFELHEFNCTSKFLLRVILKLSIP